MAARSGGESSTRSVHDEERVLSSQICELRGRRESTSERERTAVGLEPLRVRALGHDAEPALDAPREEDRPFGLAVLGRELLDERLAQDRRVVLADSCGRAREGVSAGRAVRGGRARGGRTAVGGEVNALGGAVLAQGLLRAVGVRLDLLRASKGEREQVPRERARGSEAHLVDGGDNLGRLEEDLEVLDGEVGHAAETSRVRRKSCGRRGRGGRDGPDLLNLAGVRLKKLLHLSPRLAEGRRLAESRHLARREVHRLRAGRRPSQPGSGRAGKGKASARAASA